MRFGLGLGNGLGLRNQLVFGGSGALLPPRNLYATVVSSTSIQLDWTNGPTPLEETDGTYVYQALVGGEFVLVATVCGTVNTKLITGLTDNTTYYFKVVHFKGTKLSSYSNMVVATTELALPAQRLASEYIAYVTSVGGVTDTLSNIQAEYQLMINEGEILEDGTDIMTVINLGLWGYKINGSSQITDLYGLVKIADNYPVYALTANYPKLVDGYIDMRPNGALAIIPISLGFGMQSFYFETKGILYYNTVRTNFISPVTAGTGFAFQTNPTHEMRFTYYSPTGTYTPATGNYTAVTENTYRITLTRTKVGETNYVQFDRLKNGVVFGTSSGALESASSGTFDMRFESTSAGSVVKVKYIKFAQKKTIVSDFFKFLQREDVDNLATNNAIDETRYYTPKFLTYSALCPTPASIAIQRRAFPCMYKFGKYAFLTYLAGNSHSINALLPHKLEIARSSNLFQTSEILPIKCINDGGTMREIDILLDGFFVNMPGMIQSPDGRIWMQVPTFNITQNPPVSGTDWIMGKTYLTYSDDFGDTWSELIELDADSYVASSKGIVVGEELWFIGYNVSKTLITEQNSYILRYNYLTNTVGVKTRMDAAWTGMSTTEPAILEYSKGKFIGIGRVNYNANFPGAETVHKGLIIAYSNDGLDWTNYEFLDWGGALPNNAKLFMMNGYVYITNNNSMYHGTPSPDLSHIDWVVKTDVSDWRLRYGYSMMAYEMIDGGYIYRKDPRVGKETDINGYLRVGGLDMVVWDEAKETLLATIAFKKDGSGFYLGEPWVGIIKRNSVKTGLVLTERLLFQTEIPGDADTSNTIKIYNSYVRTGDTVTAEFVAISNRDKTIAVTVSDYYIEFVASSAVHNAKLVFEIIKP